MKHSPVCSDRHNRLFDTDDGVLACAARTRFSVAGQRQLQGLP